MTYDTPYQKRLQRRLLPWFLVGMLAVVHVALSRSEARVESRYEQQRWVQIEQPRPLMPR